MPITQTLPQPLSNKMPLPPKNSPAIPSHMTVATAAPIHRMPIPQATLRITTPASCTTRPVFASPRPYDLANQRLDNLMVIGIAHRGLHELPPCTRSLARYRLTLNWR